MNKRLLLTISKYILQDNMKPILFFSLNDLMWFNYTIRIISGQKTMYLLWKSAVNFYAFLVIKIHTI